MKISGCASNLESRKDQEGPYRAHRYCQDRFCPSCSWWKSEQLKKRFEAIRPAIEKDYPGFQWVYATLTLTPCLTEMIEVEIRQISQSFTRLIERLKRRDLEVLGYYRFTELDRFSEEESRIHLHAVLLVPLVGMSLLTKSWLSGLWSESINLNYLPRVQIDWKDEDKPVSDWIGYSSKPMVSPGDELDEKYFEWIVMVAPYVHGKHLYVPGGVIRNYLSKSTIEETISDVVLETPSPVRMSGLVMLNDLAGEAINTQYKQDVQPDLYQRRNAA